MPEPHAARVADGAIRVRSVDVFRGVTMAAMVIVNNPGDWNNVYTPLLHAPWHGWTPTDLVFPFFLFIVGVAVTVSPSSGGAMRGVVRRSVTIFALGLFLAGFPFFDLATLRIPGVLQRIAVCYLAAVVIVRLTTPHNGDRRLHLRRLFTVTVAIVVAYAVLLLWVPVPGGRAGDLSGEGNLGAWVDRALMQGHLWRETWDPEGLLSTLPAVATTLIGVIAGRVRQEVPTLARWRRALIIGGIVSMTLGALWHPWFPINKSLWTSSYVLFTGGFAAIVLALCSAWADPLNPTLSSTPSPQPSPFFRGRGGRGERALGWRLRTTEPFVALGRNAILLFVLSGLVARLMGVVMVDHAAGLSLKEWIYATFFAPLAAPRNASLLFAIANLAVLYALLTWLHRRRWYWRA